VVALSPIRPPTSAAYLIGRTASISAAFSRFVNATRGLPNARGACEAGAMPKALPPPQERFDPVTARWFTPGGPLHDPELESLDPEHRLPIELVGPVPPELVANPEAGTDGAHPRPGRAVIAFWLIVALVAAGGAGLVMSTTQGYCPDPGECTVVNGGGPLGWAIAIALVALAIYAIRRALRRDRSGSAT
jgi:hypothetical protein